MFNKTLLSLAVASVLLAGCGSGSGTNTPTDTASSSTVTGSAAKGIVKMGIVTAYTLDASGNPGTEAVGTAMTDDKGLYSLTLNDSYDGTSPLLIELTAGADTLMVCDSRDGCGSVAFGGDIALAGTGFKLSAVSTSVTDGATVNTSITPFTSMAAANVQAGSDGSDAAILAAVSKVNQIVGVNITETNPVNIADDLASADADAQQYTIMLAALAEQAFEDTDSDSDVDIDDAIANLAAFNEDFEDGTIGGSTGLSPSELYEDALEEIADSNSALSDADAISSFATSQDQVADSNGDTLAPAQTSGENPTEVAQAKAFVGEVRTWANSLQDLEGPTELFLDEAGTITDALGSDGQAVLDVLAMAIGAVAEEISTPTGTEGAINTSLQLDDEGTPVGTVTLVDSSTADTTTITASSSDLNGVSMSATISVNSSLEPDSIAAGDTVFSLSGIAASDDVSLSLADASFTVSLAETIALDDNSETDELEAASFSGVMIKGKLTAELLDSGVSTNEMLEADAELKLVALNSSVVSLKNDVNMSLEKIALNDLSVTNAAGSTARLSASLTMKNATSFDTFAFLSYESVIEDGISNDFSLSDFDLSGAKSHFGINTFTQLYYGYYVKSGPNSTTMGNSAYSYSGPVYDSGVGTCASGTDPNGGNVQFSCVKQDVAGLSTQMTAKYDDYTSVNSVEVKDFWYDGNPDGYLSGYNEITLNDLESADNFLDATLSITGNVDLADHPAATLSIIANKTGLKKGDLTATLAYSGKSMQMVTNTDGGEQENTSGSMSFSNADGVAMTVNSSSDWESGTVMVGDAVVGVMESTDGVMIIRYNDGTFESL